MCVFCLSSCDNREWDVPHYGRKELKEACFVADTIFMDGRRTSLLGQWLMTPETLCFFDECMVGVKVYSLSGDFIDVKITKVVVYDLEGEFIKLY